MTNDEQLLHAYARERSESAFGELVARHIDFVYSTALRVLNGDSHLAQDVAQTVFIDLARKAGSLPGGVDLTGWLHRHTCYIAATAVRTERRRQSREQTAMEMRALDDNTRSEWEHVAPYLDESLNQLNPADRDALVLRFLKQQDLRTVGEALGISDDAAQKRVDRALEKLHVLLKHRGATLSAAALGTALATEAVTAAPAGLAASVAGAALASAAAGGGTTATLVKLITMTKLKTALMVAAMAAALTPALLQHQAGGRLNQENARLTNELVVRAAPAPTRATNKVPAGPDAAARTQQEITRLNALAGKLTAEVAQLEQMRAENGKLRVQLAMPPAGLLTPEESEALAKVKEEEESIACANNMKQLLLAVRAWAKDNGDRNPPDVLSMSNKLGTPKDLLCPGDHAREPAKDWASCTLANCSYEYLAPSVLHSDRETQGVLFRCPIHGHVGLCEGSVQNRLAKKNPEWLVQHGGMLYVDWPRPGGGSAHAQQPGNPPLGGSRPGGSNK